ncbi:hypothetical protein [Halalkalibacter nanhaiisediminis]|uniref:Uncharacterized protein n=1 Tax=Halalkalibacter nanhaiisediminis TaxID=688079 RepID=A0A562QN29_9BACI|nr:hypothetical protein [Halalkalibacter nanhaiisediminis]TWI58158.1 hypothetical protein IQ10_01491 [Halalkalibacter nanhaiisediminis]
MNPQYFYQGYVPQQIDYSMYDHYYPYVQQEHLHQQQPDQEEFMRQPPQSIERRVNQLERQNERQIAELTRQNQEIRRINEEINRINQEVIRLNRNDEIHTGRLNRLNRRLRQVENRLGIPFSGAEDGF